MDINIGDFVTRISHNHDMVFKVIKIDDDIATLKGMNVRLIADSLITDLVKSEYVPSDDSEEVERFKDSTDLDRDDYFYLPGKILHIDGDSEYLERCLKYYNNVNLMAMGICIEESEVSSKIKDYLLEYNPNILVITGHDAYYSKKGNTKDINNYKNSINFVNAVKEARRYEKSHDKLIIIAGACQSDYEELIRAGANFASSPKRVNIHALDPAIIACYVAKTDRCEIINLDKILSKTKYGKEGIGGVISYGVMLTGAPRKGKN